MHQPPAQASQPQVPAAHLLANRVAQRANAVSAEVGEKGGRQGPLVSYFPCLDLAVWIMRLMAFTYAFALDTMMSLSAPRPV